MKCASVLSLRAAQQRYEEDGIPKASNERIADLRHYAGAQYAGDVNQKMNDSTPESTGTPLSPYVSGPVLASLRARSLARTVVVLVLALGYALLAHFSTSRGGHGTLGALLAIGPVGCVALIFAWRSMRRVLAITAWLLAVVFIAAHWHELKAEFVWIYLIQQIGIYCLLGISFGRTLAPEHVPLCTQMALHVHGALSADALRYTRQVTMAWTLFFATIAAALIIVFFFAPLQGWSAFANFGIPILIISMFAVEGRVRRRALPDMAHAGIIATIRASTAVGFGAAERCS